MKGLVQGIIFPLGNSETVFLGNTISDSSFFAGGVLGNEGAQTTESTNTETLTETPLGTDEAVPPAGGSLLDLLPVAILWGGLLFAMYFFLFRPQKKREKQMVEMQDSLKVGDNIVTTAGFFGKIVEIGQDALVIEFGTNRGVRVPVRKSDISGIKTPVLTPPHNKTLTVAENNDKNKDIDKKEKNS